MKTHLRDTNGDQTSLDVEDFVSLCQHMNLTASPRLQLTQTHESQPVWYPAKLPVIQLMFGWRFHRFQSGQFKE